MLRLPLLKRCLVLAGLTLVATAAVARADVTRFDITSRSPVGHSGYEKIIGIAHFAVDRKAAANAVIADIDKAPVNAAGKVEFSSDVYILRPLDPAKSNGVALVDVLNRGRKVALTGFNRGGTSDPVTDADLGDGFLMQHGFTVVWVGWEFDIRRYTAGQPGQAERGAGMAIKIPSAQGVIGVVRAAFTPNDDGPQTVGDLAGYRPLDEATTDLTLSVRDGEFGPRSAVARDRFAVRGNQVTLTDGFEKGRTYELSYRPTEWPVSGLGLAAYRDLTAWVKHAPNAVAHADKAIGFGSSQSGRFLRTFLYYGFNADEQGRPVLDGAMVHIAGAARLSINERGAQPTALSMYTATQFPFAAGAQHDPITGRTDGLLDNPRARATQPKVMFTNTAVEYWGGGRAAALVHTSADGTHDLTLPANVRAYFLTGAQHGPAPFPVPAGGLGQQPANPLEYWWTLRALLVGMTDWVVNGTAPPASQVPTLADGTLLPVAQLKWPALRGVQSPTTVTGPRYDGHDLPFLVPQVDADGNEIAGIRTAEQRVPTATHTGWNFRNAAIGGAAQLVNLLGAAIPFARTKAERTAAGDLRLSVDERYPSKEHYLAKASAVAQALVQQQFLLPADVAGVMARMEARWSWSPPLGADRMPPIAADQRTDAQRKAVEEFKTARGVELSGPFHPLLRSPELMTRTRAMGDYLRHKSALPPRLSEFVILLTAREWTQQYEWHAHHPLALKAGLDPTVAQAVAEGRRPMGMNDDEALLYDFCLELLRTKHVSDQTYGRALARYGEQGVIDTIGIVGYYSMLAMVLNGTNAPLPPGITPPLLPLAPGR